MKYKNAQVITEWAIAIALVSVVVVGMLMAFADQMKGILHNISGAYDQGIQSSRQESTKNE